MLTISFGTEVNFNNIGFFIDLTFSPIIEKDSVHEIIKYIEDFLLSTDNIQELCKVLNNKKYLVTVLDKDVYLELYKKILFNKDTDNSRKVEILKSLESHELEVIIEEVLDKDFIKKYRDTKGLSLFKQVLFNIDSKYRLGKELLDIFMKNKNEYCRTILKQLEYFTDRDYIFESLLIRVINSNINKINDMIKTLSGINSMLICRIINDYYIVNDLLTEEQYKEYVQNYHVILHSINKEEYFNNKKYLKYMLNYSI